MWFENQFPYFMWMVLCGAGIMFFYDFLKISRRMMHHPDFLVNLEDIVFASISAVVVFYVTYVKNNGEVRWQTFAGLLIGFVLYMLIFRGCVVKAGCFIIEFVWKILIKILKIILFPFVLLIKIILKPAKIIFWYTGRGVKHIRTRGSLALKNIRNIIRKK